MKVKASAILKAIEGGKEPAFYIRQLKDGRTILCAIPDFSKRELSPKQKESQIRFKLAAAYAREAAKNQPIYSELAKGTMKTAYNIAVSDWFHAPEIVEVKTSMRKGEAGQVIRIQAVDDVLVTQVKVIIKSDEDVTLEEGAAFQTSDAWWSYTTTVQAKDGARIVVTASDLAGNTMEEIKIFD